MRAIHRAVPLVPRTPSPLTSARIHPPTYVTWLLRPTPAGCAIRLEIYEVDDAGSPQEAEDVWRPVFTALQLLVNPT